jgi:hypothetical protein
LFCSFRSFLVYFDPQPLRTQLWIPLLKHAMAAQKIEQRKRREMTIFVFCNIYIYKYIMLHKKLKNAYGYYIFKIENYKNIERAFDFQNK